MPPTSDRTGARVRLFAVLALLGSLAGCGGNAEKAAPLELGPLPRITSESQYRFPLDDYLPTSAQQAAYSRAFRILVEECVASFGVVYAPGAATVRSAYLWDDSLGLFRIYNHGAGVVDERRAARYGYRDPDEPAATPIEEPAPPSADLLVAVNGPGSAADGARLHDRDGDPVPGGGCYRVAQDRLGGEGPGLPDLRPARRTSDEATGSPVYGRALDAWVECMRAAGHRDASTPQDYGFRYGFPGSPTVAETALALDDVRCKRSSRVADAYVALRIAQERRFIDEHRAGLDAYRTWAHRVSVAVATALGSA